MANLGLLLLQVARVVLLQDIQFKPENWPVNDTVKPVLITRNLTISSSPRFNAVDFAFLGSSWLKLAPGVQITFTDTILRQSR